MAHWRVPLAALVGEGEPEGPELVLNDDEREEDELLLAELVARGTAWLDGPLAPYALLALVGDVHRGAALMAGILGSPVQPGIIGPDNWRLYQVGQAYAEVL